MAAIEEKSGGSTNRIGRKKLSTRVDLTPMVDLGFLLITFFIFTTALQKPTAMNLYLPNEKAIDIPMKTARSKVLQLIPTANNKVFYFEGDDINNLRETGFYEDGLRQIILRKKQQVGMQFGDAKEMLVMIKPTDECTYENVVSVLDEMLINDVKRYMLIDAGEAEKISVLKHRE